MDLQTEKTSLLALSPEDLLALIVHVRQARRDAASPAKRAQKARVKKTKKKTLAAVDTLALEDLEKLLAEITT